MTPAAATPRLIPSAAPSAGGSAEEQDQRGGAFTQSGKFPEVVVELTQAIQLKPDFELAYNARGYAYLLQRDYPARARGS